VVVGSVMRGEGLVMSGEAGAVRHGILQRQVVLCPGILGHQDEVIADQVGDWCSPVQAKIGARVYEQRHYSCCECLCGAASIEER
jgi:hypothetical protein